jgi:hypothetical protein
LRADDPNTGKTVADGRGQAAVQMPGSPPPFIMRSQENFERENDGR